MKIFNGKVYAFTLSKLMKFSIGIKLGARVRVIIVIEFIEFVFDFFNENIPPENDDHRLVEIEGESRGGDNFDGRKGYKHFGKLIIKVFLVQNYFWERDVPENDREIVMGE